MRPPNWVTQKGKVLRVGNGCAIKVAGNMQIKHKLFSHRPTHTPTHRQRFTNANGTHIHKDDSTAAAHICTQEHTRR